MASLVALIVILAARDSGGSGDARFLSHTAVEKYIQYNLGAQHVVCNGGKDFAMTADGQTFTCHAAGGETFRVTITNKDSGSYLVHSR